MRKKPFKSAIADLLISQVWLVPIFFFAFLILLTCASPFPVFAEFSPGTPFLPMATELSTGKVELIYLNLEPNVEVPKYPESASFKDKPTELTIARKQYWKFFRDNFSSIVAMQAVEAKASSGETIRWIDYRVPLEDGKPCLHLSVSAYGRYHTGTFAYRWVQRGYNHGLRIVGTMKSGPAMNVLAVFER
jgi:hypothetical protein